MTHPARLTRGVYRYQHGALVVLVAIDASGQLVGEHHIVAPTALDELNATTDLLLTLHDHERPPKETKPE